MSCLSHAASKILIFKLTIKVASNELTQVLTGPMLDLQFCAYCFIEVDDMFHQGVRHLFL
jgi:hypothetical protein